MKKASSDIEINDVSAMDNSDKTSNAKTAVAGKGKEIIKVADLSKFEFDAEMDLESEIMRDLNQPQMEPDEPEEDTDSSTSEDVDTDPFCGL